MTNKRASGFKGNSLLRIKAIMLKEFYQILRDPSSILLSIVMPLVLLFLYGFAVSLDMNHLRIGLVLEDTSPSAQSFAKALTDSRYFDVTISRTRQDFIEGITSGHLRGIVVVPAYFTQFLNKQNVSYPNSFLKYDHEQSNIAPIQVITDGSQPNTASFVQNYVRGAWQTWLAQEQISSHNLPSSYINTQMRFWYNEGLESRNFLIPGSIAIVMTLVGTLLTSLVVAREWERGTMEALMSTPISIAELLIGKLVPYFILGMISMLICLAIAVFGFVVPFRGSFAILIAISALFLCTALMLGLLISSILRNQFLAAQAAMVAAFLPAFILSGFVFEISSMPFFTRMITYIVPARYFVTVLQTLFLVGNVWKLIIVNSLIILFLGSLLFYVTSQRTVKRLD